MTSFQSPLFDASFLFRQLGSRHLLGIFVGQEARDSVSCVPVGSDVFSDSAAHSFKALLTVIALPCSFF